MFILASDFLKLLQHFYFDLLVAITSEKREKAKYFFFKVNKSSAVINIVND